LSLSGASGMDHQEAVIRIDTIVNQILDSRFIGDYAKIEKTQVKVSEAQQRAIKGENHE